MQFWSKLKFYLAIINKHSRVYWNESGMRIDNNPAGDIDTGRRMAAAKTTPFLCKFHFLSFEQNKATKSKRVFQIN